MWCKERAAFWGQAMAGNSGHTEFPKQRNLVDLMLVFGFESDPDADPPGERMILVKPQRAFYKEDQECPVVRHGLMGAQGAHFEKGWKRCTAVLWMWHTFIPEPLDLAKKEKGHGRQVLHFVALVRSGVESF